jgi:hypothetical protein
MRQGNSYNYCPEKFVVNKMEPAIIYEVEKTEELITLRPK